jgi:hypothetical protein
MNGTFFLWALVAGAIWLAITTAIYYFTLRSAVGRMHPGLQIPVVIVIAAFLSPGLMFGHGVMPFPGGVAYLLLGYMEIRNLIDQAALINLFWWVVTAVVFLFLPDRDD